MSTTAHANLAADESTSTILSAFSTLPDPQLSALIECVVLDTHHRHRRISAILSTPTLFSLAILRLLSLPDKSFLISHLLLSSLHCLTLPFVTQLPPHAVGCEPCSEQNTALQFLHWPCVRRMMPGDEDAVLLLLLLCDLQHRHPQVLDEASPSEWRHILKDLCYDTMVSLSGIGSHHGGALVPFVETVVRCHRYVSSMTCPVVGGEEVAASASTVLQLPWVEVDKGGGECVVCWEEMREGRQACELPCRHMFHWTCILPWLRKRNTCPCCRYELPTDDIYGEIQRLWNMLMKRGQLVREGKCGQRSAGRNTMGETSEAGIRG
ncbi:hypothetical protein MLD38_029887 [Melastoma candidum]|uniref:Uncharacterized protein n=1 Tax=Melastoma candidum TaxID=119954 RepID=A0ACB9N5H0_9MYRT|nr:hypothetical protein MLD38_029887 [Melastoma candidum]